MENDSLANNQQINFILCFFLPPTFRQWYASFVKDIRYSIRKHHRKSAHSFRAPTWYTSTFDDRAKPMKITEKIARTFEPFACRQWITQIRSPNQSSRIFFFFPLIRFLHTCRWLYLTDNHNRPNSPLNHTTLQWGLIMDSLEHLPLTFATLLPGANGNKYHFRWREETITYLLYWECIWEWIIGFV